MNEKEALVILNHLSIKSQNLAHFDSATSFLRTLPLSTWEKLTTWQEDLKLIEQHEAHIIGITESDYPQKLLDLYDPPLILYIKGELSLFDRTALAVVGTRRCTLYGKEMAEKLAFEVASYGVVVVSGLARGIDTAAHTGALAGGLTIAVLGSGLGHIYPPENRSLAEKITKRGALISELPMSAGPKPYHFPKRNRLIAALSDGILLAEGPKKSGGMITLEAALNLQKKCFTIPGRIDIDTFSGNHELLKRSQATLVENGQEMLSLLPSTHTAAPATETPSLFDLEEEEKKLLDNFPGHEISLEQLLMISGLTVAKLNARLLALCLKGAVRELPGKLYKRTLR